MSWTYLKIIVVCAITIVNSVLSGDNPILDVAPQLHVCISFISWFIDYIFPGVESYVRELSPEEAEILAGLL